jgi:hypothetical protein
MKLLLVSSRIRFNTLPSTFLCLLLLPLATHAQKIDKSKLDNAAKRSSTAARVLTSVVNMPDTIPGEIEHMIDVSVVGRGGFSQVVHVSALGYALLEQFRQNHSLPSIFHSTRQLIKQSKSASY